MTGGLIVKDEQAMLALGRQLANDWRAGGIVHLSGQLGAGKTTLVRGVLKGLGFDGRVKSPSYGLVESYELPRLMVHHLDLYRLGHPEELAFLGLEDLLDGRVLLLVEWPEKGRGWLPGADWKVRIEHRDTAREVVFDPSTCAGRR